MGFVHGLLGVFLFGKRPIDAIAVCAQQPGSLGHVATRFGERPSYEPQLPLGQIQRNVGRNKARGARNRLVGRRRHRLEEVQVLRPSLSMRVRSMMFFRSRTLPGNE